jgi:ubiquinone/menaquinone biosynthesis C-methylase UbiE
MAARKRQNAVGKRRRQIVKPLEPLVPIEKATPTEARRMLQWQLGQVGLSNKQIAGKRILDVGAGIAKLDFLCHRGKVNSEIVSLEPWEKQLTELRKRGLKVAGWAEELPIKSNQFDHVVAIASVPLYSDSPRHTALTITEMLRVVKPRGSVRISPYWSPLNGKKEQWAKRLNEFTGQHLLNLLKNSNFGYKVFRHESGVRALIIYKYKKSDLEKLKKALLKKASKKK